MARIAVEGGYDAIWISEVAGFDAFALGSRLAAEVPGFPLRIGPVAVPLRTAPQLAMSAASLEAFGCPIEVVLGASSPTIVEQWHGRHRTTVHQIEVLVRTLRCAIAGTETNETDEVGPSSGFRLGLPPRHDLRIAVAALGPRTLRAAAQIADRVVLNYVTPDRASELVDFIRAEAALAGRVQPDISVWVHATVDADEQMREESRVHIARYLRAPGYRENFSAQGYAEVVNSAVAAENFREVVRLVSDEMLDTFFYTGNRDSIRMRLTSYQEMGISVGLVCALSDGEAASRTFRALAPASAAFPI